MIDLPPPPKFWIPTKPAIIRAADPELLRRPQMDEATFPMPVFCPSGKPILTNPDSYSSGTDAASYNTGAKSIGTPGTRLIVVAAASYSFTGTVNTCTIDGSGMTSIVARLTNSRSRQLYAHIFALPWNNANTTATFVLGCSGTVTSIAMRIFNIMGLQSTTPTHTTTAGGGDGIWSTTCNLNFLQDGVGVAVTSLWDFSVPSATGLPNYNQMYIEWPKAMMWGDRMAAETGRALTFNHGGGTAATTVAASWR